MQQEGLLQLLRRYPSLLMLCVATAIIMLGQGLTGPVLPLFAKSFNATAASVGLTISAFGLGRLVLNIPVGVMSDSFGRRFVLVVGPIIVCITSIMSGLAGSLWELMLWRFLAGAGAAMFQTGAAVYLTDISDADSRARMMGLNQGSLLVGVSIGPAVGGFVAELINFRAAFYLVGVLAAICAVWAFVSIPETNTKEARQAARSERRQGNTSLSHNLAILTSMPFFLISMVTLAQFLTRSGTRQTIMPLLGDEHFGISPGGLGLIFTLISALNLICVPYAGAWADRFGRKAVIVPASAVTALSLAMLAWPGGVAMFVVASIVQGIGTGFAGPAPAAYAADVAPDEARGFAMGLYRTYGDFGLTLGPPLMGFIADHADYNASVYFNAALVGVTALAFWGWAPETVDRRRIIAVEGEAPVEAAGRPHP